METNIDKLKKRLDTVDLTKLKEGLQRSKEINDVLVNDSRKSNDIKPKKNKFILFFKKIWNSVKSFFTKPNSTIKPEDFLNSESKTDFLSKERFMELLNYGGNAYPNKEFRDEQLRKERIELSKIIRKKCVPPLLQPDLDDLIYHNQTGRHLVSEDIREVISKDTKRCEKSLNTQLDIKRRNDEPHKYIRRFVAGKGNRL